MLAIQSGVFHNRMVRDRLNAPIRKTPTFAEAAATWEALVVNPIRDPQFEIRNL